MPTKGIAFLLALAIWGCEIKKDTFFTKMPPGHTGVKFKNLLKETEEFNVLTYGYLYNGGGVAIGDINNDGLADIYFTGNMVASRLYLNQGDWNFDEISESAGVSAAGLWNTGTTMADVNGDGWLDIYVCRSAAQNPDSRKNQLFINTTPLNSSGEITFSEQGQNYGLADHGYSTQSAFFDYDKDGDLDMYLLNHSVQQFAGLNPNIVMLKQREDPNYGDKLFRNDEGKFRNVTASANIKSNVLGFGLGIAVSDLNGDQWPDIYISNDYNEQDYLYINNQDGTFSDQLQEYVDHTSLFSMGSDIADINNDGFTDIMTLDMWPEENERQKMVIGPDNYDKYQKLKNSGFYHQSMRNMLQLNQGGRGFSEIGRMSGVSATDWSWTSLLADFDNDGYKDLFITNGYKRDYTNMDFLTYVANEKLRDQGDGKEINTMELIREMPSISTTNYMFQNQGDLTFTKKSVEWGFGDKTISNGAAYGDLDNDGDLDLAVNNIDDFAFLYRNNAETFTQNHWLKVSLRGREGNTSGIGATVTLVCGENRFYQEVMPTRGFQSSVEPKLTFGIGEATVVESLTVLWPDGTNQELKDLSADQEIQLTQDQAKNPGTTKPASTPPTSAQATLGLDYLHKENYFVDFKEQGLLPQMLSTLGPRMAIGDTNGDKLEDIFIGGAKGSSGRLFIQNKSGTFDAQDPFSDIGSEDMDALFFDADGDLDADLYVVSGGSAFQPDSPELMDRLYLNDGTGNFSIAQKSLPAMLTSGSCVTAGDYDSDGDLDLFVGGRLIPGQYPLAPRSYVLENDGQGNFSDVTSEMNPALKTIGMVTDAIWSDFNGDKNPDLIIVGEWIGVTLLENSGGVLQDVSATSGTKDSEGWWNRIVQADFDNDGDLDYALGNFGWNSDIKASPSQPASLYVKDFDKNGTIDPILCYYVQGESYPAFSKDDMEGQLNLVKKRYLKYEDYADKKITDIFTPEELKDTVVFKSRNFSSSYMENLGSGQFEIRDLPVEAQVSPVYGILVHDFNNDGNLDLMLGGNFSATRVKFGKYDANKGVILEGNGQGGFSAITSLNTGVMVKGEVRDIRRLKRVSGDIMVIAKNNDSLEVQNVPTY